MMRMRRWFAPLLAVTASAGAALLWHGALRGAGKDDVTWSGRIRIERTISDKTHCEAPIGSNRCSGPNLRDDTDEKLYVTEYLVDRARQDGTDVSADARLELRGTVYNHIRTLSKTPEGNVEWISETRLKGSGQTTASVSIFLREAGEDDSGKCRLEFSPVGQRDDGGPLSGAILLRGTTRSTVRGGSHPSDETKPAEEQFDPDGEQFDLPCALNARALRGQKVENDKGGVRTVVSWDLVRDGEPQTEVELILPKEYDKWRPQAGENEGVLGNFIDVKVIAHKKGDRKAAPPQKVKTYKIDLIDVSREKGVDCNWPPKSVAKDDFDLKIDDDNPWIKVEGPGRQRADTKQEGLAEFRFTVDSYDWGAHGRVRVVAELEGGGEVVAHVEGQPKVETPALPKDDNDNGIADGWEAKYGVKDTSPSADEDQGELGPGLKPHGDGHDGDGIALYDEYRGFHVQGRREGLSPKLKDLFVWDALGLGAGVFPMASKIRTHLITVNERTMHGNTNVANHQQANPNSRERLVYALWLHRWDFKGTAVGDTTGGPGVPRDILDLAIDPAALAAADSKDIQGETRWAIAHELGHAVNIQHHGDIDHLVTDVRCKNPGGGTEVWPCTGEPANPCYTMARRGGTFSGDEKCIMRYYVTDLFKLVGGSCQVTWEGARMDAELYGIEPPGTRLCDSAAATGVNAGPRSKAGEASRGDCIHQYCVNSWRH